MDSRFAGKKILLLDGLTSQCLEYTKAFNGLGCDTTVLCDDRFDPVYARVHRGCQRGADDCHEWQKITAGLLGFIAI